MATAQHVFNISMALMDELSLSEGQPVHAETRDYLLRTPKILTVLCNELYKFSDTWEKSEPGTRPVYAEVTGMEQELALDSFITDTVLPYGLAAHLLAEESPSLASFFLQRYQGLIFNHGGAIPVVTEPIRDLYGGV
ncbi:MAG: hypothetical protein FWC96_07475 [Oscillospiraceae bacterium]|nr:hypothetical protein [Oscillospiraceae bacterium]